MILTLQYYLSTIAYLVLAKYAAVLYLMHYAVYEAAY